MEKKEITSVWSVQRASLLKQRWVFLSPVCALCYVAYTFFWHTFTNPLVVFILLLPFVIVCASAYQKALEQFMRAFAERHHLSYQGRGEAEAFRGRLFSVGHSKEVRHLLQGTIVDPFSLFFYQYTVGSGKNSTVYVYTVASCRYPDVTFPFFALTSREQKEVGASDRSGVVRDVSVPLEPAFAECFTLTATQGYETEVLQIFTPEVLQELVQRGAHYRLEFFEHAWFLSVDTRLTEKESLERFFATASYLAETLGPLLHRLHDDFAAMGEYVRE